MGKRRVPDWLVQVAERNDSDAIYMAYKLDANVMGRVGRVRTMGGRHTTWTTGRNILYQEALEMQRLQGWSHEYFVFADFDCGLLPDQVDIFHRRLTALQPAVAAVGRRNKCDPWPCSGDVDAQFNAFHATAAPIFLPYDTSFDNVTWWGSQQVMRVLLTGSAPDYVVEFTDLHFARRNRHSHYPRGYLKDTVVDYLLPKVNPCLHSQILPMKSHLQNKRHDSCHQCPLTAACNSSTFCEGEQETPLRDYSKLIQCKPF